MTQDGEAWAQQKHQRQEHEDRVDALGIRFLTREESIAAWEAYCEEQERIGFYVTRIGATLVVVGIGALYADYTTTTAVVVTSVVVAAVWSVSWVTRNARLAAQRVRAWRAGR